MAKVIEVNIAVTYFYSLHSYLLLLTSQFVKYMQGKIREPSLKGRLYNTVDLLFKIGCFVNKKNIVSV